MVFSGTAHSSAKGENLVASFIPFTHDFLIQEFAGNADLAAIDTIVVIFQAITAGLDYEIDNIEVTGIREELTHSRP